MSNSRTRMKLERKNPRYRLYLRRRSTPDLLASGVASITFNSGDYVISVTDDADALNGDIDAIVRDARRAYSACNERESA